jgi:hypothetical protein
MAEEYDDVPFDDVATEDEVVNGGEMTEDPYSQGQDGDVGQMLISANEGLEDRTPEEIEADIMQIESLAATYPEIREMPEYQNLLEAAERVKGEELIDDEEEYDEEEYDEEEYDEEEYDEDEDDIFGLSSGVEADDLEFEIDEEMANYITSHYGLENVETFFNTVDTWRNQSQEGAKAKSELDDLTEGLSALPKELKAAIHAYANAEDYIAAFNSTGARLNYDEPYSKQDKEVVLQHYFGDKLSSLKERLEDGDIDDIDYEERVDLLFDSGHKLFEQDKKMMTERRAELMREQEDLEENLRSSALSSVEQLKEKFPNFSRSEMQRIRQRLVDGDIESLFYNEDGTFNEDAAERLAFSMYGSKVFDNLIQKAEMRGQSQANEKIVKRGNKSPRSRKGQRSVQNQEAMGAVSHLNSQFKDDPYV